MLAEVITATLGAVVLGSLWFAHAVTAPERPKKRRKCGVALGYGSICAAYNRKACEVGLCPKHCDERCRCQTEAC